MRILIVDDDLVCSRLLGTILKPYGDCVTASDGEAAIRLTTEALIRKQPFDLLCLDIQMPGIDGQMALRCLRAVEAAFGRVGLHGATILMVTSQDDAKNISAAFRGQCEGYIVKPIAEAQIVAQLAGLDIEPIAQR